MVLPPAYISCMLTTPSLPVIVLPPKSAQLSKRLLPFRKFSNPQHGRAVGRSPRSFVAIKGVDRQSKLKVMGRYSSTCNGTINSQIYLGQVPRIMSFMPVTKSSIYSGAEPELAIDPP
jgi:hypothetical protein